MTDKLDVVIFGATGFTGKHAVKELSKITKERPLSWGIAGRTENKLKAVLEYWTNKTGEFAKCTYFTFVTLYIYFSCFRYWYFIP